MGLNFRCVERFAYVGTAGAADEDVFGGQSVIDACDSQLPVVIVLIEAYPDASVQFSSMTCLSKMS